MKNQSVYIVEDSPIISKILTKIISQIDGVESKDYRHGEDMLEQLEIKKPQLIFLDYFLDTKKQGFMNGEEVFRKLKDKFPGIPVVMLTGMTDDQKLQKIKMVGFDRVIHKDHDRFFEKVQDCVQQYVGDCTKDNRKTA